jgi:hypothetical protein
VFRGRRHRSRERVYNSPDASREATSWTLLDRSREVHLCGYLHSATNSELIRRDKLNLDITWLRDDSLEDLDNLPAPEVIARESVEDLTAALAEFDPVATELENGHE